MTDTREQIRMRLWVETRIQANAKLGVLSADSADNALKEFDARFPERKLEDVEFSDLKTYQGDISNFDAAYVVAFDRAKKTVTLRFKVMPHSGIGEKWIVRTQDCSQP